jgi:hypothetical protein
MIEHTATNHTRRNLLLALGAGSVGAAAFGAPALQLSLAATHTGTDLNWWDRMFFSLQNGSVAEWSSVIGQVFSVEGEKGKTQLLLSEVKLLPSKGTRPAECGRNQAFSLLFLAAPNTAPSGDRTYSVTHPAYPALDVYLSAATVLPRGVRLLAVFN